jgi:hypothetical protein
MVSGGVASCGVVKDDPLLQDGQVVLAWTTLMHAFGTVEVLERTQDFDVGPNRRGGRQPTWLAVCVDPFYAAYRGSLAVVRQFRNGVVFVLAVDNDDVLFGEVVRDVVAEKAAATAAATRYVFQLTSVLGNAFIETDGGGVITQATGEYGSYYIGMDFRAFVTGLRQADPKARYVRLWGDWQTSTRLSL